MKSVWNLFLVLATGALIAAACTARNEPGSSAGDALAPGDPAPEFSLPSVDGGTVALSDYRGEQPVLLYFHMAMG